MPSFRYLVPESDAGFYQAGVLSGTMAAGLAGDSEILQFRWTSATRLAIIDRVRIRGISGSATAFAAGFAKVALVVARAWSADGTGGTAQTLTTNNCKLRTSMATTAAGTIRAATTAALGAGTKTLDATPLSVFSFAVGTGTSVQMAGDVPLLDTASEHTHPLVLAATEGFVITATVPATGTWQWAAEINWQEILSVAAA